MPARKRVEEEKPKRRVRRQAPAKTEEERENQLIALAVDLAEEQIREGTASAQVISHFLKLGSSREKLEQQNLKGKVELDQARIEAIAAAQRIEELYSNALSAMKLYSGQGSDEEDDEYD